MAWKLIMRTKANRANKPNRIDTPLAIWFQYENMLVATSTSSFSNFDSIVPYGYDAFVFVVDAAAAAISNLFFRAWEHKETSKWWN